MGLPIPSAPVNEAEQCAICLNALNPYDFGVLGCAHAFCHECIRPWFCAQQTCPCCRFVGSLEHIRIEIDNETVTVAATSEHAYRLALQVYDRHFAESIENPEERLALEAIFGEIRHLLESQDADEAARNRGWERVKRFLKIAGYAALAALFIYICWMYWPMIGPLMANASRFLLGMFSAIFNLLKNIWPLLKSAITRFLPGFVVGLITASCFIEQVSDIELS